jgi:hypothetical protein
LQIDQHLAQFQFIGDQVPWRLVEPIGRSTHINFDTVGVIDFPLYIR